MAKATQKEKEAFPSKRKVYGELSEYDLRPAQLEALNEYIESGGNISAGCRKAGIERNTWYVWMGEEPFKLAREIADTELARRRLAEDIHKTGVVEDVLFENAKQGKENSVFFWLKNRSPERWANDYIQGQRYLQLQQNNYNFLNVELGDMSNKELLEEAKKLSERIIEGEKDEGHAVKDS